MPSTTPDATSGHATFGIGPASDNRIDSRPNFRWEVTPGATLDDTVGIVNVGRSPLHLDVYSADAANAADGSFTLLPKNRTPVDAGRWITLRIPRHASSVDVPARSMVIVPITVVVPRNAAPGDHSAGVVASLTSYVVNKHNARVKLEQRVGVRVFIRVSGPLRPQLSVQALHAAYSGPVNPVRDGRTTVSYVVRNTGNVNLGGDQLVSIGGLVGSTEHATAPRLPMLLPGGSARFRVQVPGVYPELLMSAHVRIRPLAPAGDVDPPTRPFSGGAHFWAVPWLLVLIVLVAIAVVVAVRLRRRFVPARPRGRHGKHAALPGPTFGVSS